MRTMFKYIQNVAAEKQEVARTTVNRDFNFALAPLNPFSPFFYHKNMLGFPKKLRYRDLKFDIWRSKKKTES